MKSKIKLLLSCFLLVSVFAVVVSCGDDDEKKKPFIPDVYVISYEAELIQKFPSDDPTNLTTFLDIAGFSGGGLAYDKKNDNLYFADFYEYYEGKIWSVKAEGTPVADDIAGELYQPFSIAIDEKAGKIYFDDGADGDGPDPVVSHIYRANLDGTDATPIVSMDDAWFRAVAIHPGDEKMYFFDVNNENLYVANLDGTSPEILIPGVYGYAIQIDTKNNKIYFDDRNSGEDGELKMADLDGENIVTVDAVASRIYGIAVDAQNKKLYWSARSLGAIFKSDLDGSNKITLKDGLVDPRGIILK